MNATTQMRITDGKGLQLIFGNGLTLSVQIGRGNYSANYHFRGDNSDLPPSGTAEIAGWDSDGTWFDLSENGGDVRGYVPVDDVLRLVEFVRSLPSDLKAPEVEIAMRAFDWRAA